MDLVILAGAAFLGTVIVAVLGYLEAKEPWDTRKFLGSIVRGIVAALIIAITFKIPDKIGMREIFVAILAGAGVDVAGKRVAAAIRAGVRS